MLYFFINFDRKKYEKNISNLQQELGNKSTKIIELISELGLVNEKYKESEKNLENIKSDLEVKSNFLFPKHKVLYV